MNSDFCFSVIIVILSHGLRGIGDRFGITHILGGFVCSIAAGIFIDTLWLCILMLAYSASLFVIGIKNKEIENLVWYLTH